MQLNFKSVGQILENVLGNSGIGTLLLPKNSQVFPFLCTLSTIVVRLSAILGGLSD